MKLTSNKRRFYLQGIRAATLRESTLIIYCTILNYPFQQQAGKPVADNGAASQLYRPVCHPPASCIEVFSLHCPQKMYQPLLFTPNIRDSRQFLNLRLRFFQSLYYYFSPCSPTNNTALGANHIDRTLFKLWKVAGCSILNE